MRRRIGVGVALLAACGGVVAVAQAPDPDRAASVALLQRFQLFTDCEPLILLVETSLDRPDVTDRAREIAERRLRAARLFSEATPASAVIRSPVLYVNVNLPQPLVVSDVSLYGITIWLQKRLFDPLTRNTGLSTTWQSGSTGIGDDALLLNVLSQLLDDFLVEYVRVNAEACE